MNRSTMTPLLAALLGAAALASMPALAAGQDDAMLKLASGLPLKLKSRLVGLPSEATICMKKPTLIASFATSASSAAARSLMASSLPRRC